MIIRYSEAEIKILRRSAGILSSSEISDLLLYECGTVRSIHSIRLHAKRKGISLKKRGPKNKLTYEECFRLSEKYSFIEISKILNIPYITVYNYLTFRSADAYQNK